MPRYSIRAVFFVHVSALIADVFAAIACFEAIGVTKTARVVGFEATLAMA
jgi:hypothetical protein